MTEDQAFRQRVAKIARAEVIEMLGTPEGKKLIRSIVDDQRKPKTTRTTASQKPAKSEKATKPATGKTPSNKPKKDK